MVEDLHRGLKCLYKVWNKGGSFENILFLGCKTNVFLLNTKKTVFIRFINSLPLLDNIRIKLNSIILIVRYGKIG